MDIIEDDKNGKVNEHIDKPNERMGAGGPSPPPTPMVDFPEKLQKLLIDLKQNYKIIQKISSGIKLNRPLYQEYKNKILSNYDENHAKFIIFLFESTKHEWIQDISILRNYRYFILESAMGPKSKIEVKNNEEEIAPEIKKDEISTAKKNQLGDKKSEPSERSPHPIPQKGIRRVEEAEIEKVKNSPLVELERLIQEPLEELELEISKVVNIHGGKLTYKFGPVEVHDKKDQKSVEVMQKEAVLHDKIVRGLFPDIVKGVRPWNVQGWAWPEVLRDRKHGIQASFSIKAHENGRFTIPIKRGMNLRLFFQDMDKVFWFLSVEELKYLLEVLFKDENVEGQEVHVASAVIGKELEAVKKKVNGGKVRITWMDHLGRRKALCFFDASKLLEWEAIGKLPQSYNVHSIVRVPSIITGSLLGMEELMKYNQEMLFDLHGGQTVLNDEQMHQAQAIQVLQNKMDYTYEDILGELTKQEVIQALDQEELKQRITEFQIDLKQGFKNVYVAALENSNNLAELIKLTEQGLDELKLHYREELRENIDEVIAGQQSIAAEMNIIGEKVNENQQQVTKKIEEESHGVKKHLSKRIEDSSNELKTELLGMKKEILEKVDSLREYLTAEFKELKVRNKDALFLIIQKIQKVPGVTSKELIKSLQDELKVARSTLYRYFKVLAANNMIFSEVKKGASPGRPSRIYNLTTRTSAIIKKLKENVLNSNLSKNPKKR